MVGIRTVAEQRFSVPICMFLSLKSPAPIGASTNNTHDSERQKMWNILGYVEANGNERKMTCQDMILAAAVPNGASLLKQCELRRRGDMQKKCKACLCSLTSFRGAYECERLSETIFSEVTYKKLCNVTPDHMPFNVTSFYCREQFNF